MTGTEHAASRHRSAARFDLPALPGGAVRALGLLAPVLSLLPALAIGVAVQATSPVAQRLPIGAAGFDTAAAWLAAQPGGLGGWGSWAGGRTPGLWQAGLLIHAIAGADGAVLAAAQTAQLVLTAVAAALLWILIRRLGGGALSAGLAVAAFGIAPAALLGHAQVSAESVAVVWALVAGVLGTAVAGRAAAVASALAGLAAAVAVASAPVVALPLAVPLAVAVLRRRGWRRVRTPSVRFAPLGAGFAVGAAAWLVVLLVAAARPASGAGPALQAVLAAAPGPAGGAAAWSAALVADPLGVVVALVATAAVAVRARDRPWAALVVAAALVGIWPLGQQVAAPLTVLVPAAALAVAAALDRALVLLTDPVFRRSLVGSGWLTGVAALLVVSTIAWVIGLGALQSASASPVERTARWLRAGVPADQTVLAELGAWPDLARAHPRVGWYAVRTGGGTASSAPWRSADWIVAGAALAGARSADAARELRASTAVVRYGEGAQSLTVRAVRPSSSPSPSVTAPSTAAERAAQAAREKAGAQLAANPRIVVDAADRALLVQGLVDTRVALVLAQFATEHRVTVRAFERPPGDTSGVRSIVVVGAVDGSAVPADVDRTGELLRFLSALQGVYRATSIDATGDGVSAAFRPDPTFAPAS